MELLVTVAILALIGGIGFSRLQSVMARHTLIEARAAVELAVARARSEALRRDQPVRILLADRAAEPGTGATLVISRMAAMPLPAGAVVAWPQGGVVIYGDGSSTGGAGSVHAGSAISRFTIDAATARLRFIS